MRLNALPAMLSLVAALSLAACGSDDSNSEPTEPTSSPAQAVQAIDATSSLLGQARAAYESGDKAKAEELVSEAYVSNFEHAEGPLEEADHELTEELEDGIREELLEDVKNGAPAAEISSAIEKLQADLATAKQKLQP